MTGQNKTGQETSAAAEISLVPLTSSPEKKIRILKCHQQCSVTLPLMSGAGLLGSDDEQKCALVPATYKLVQRDQMH